MQSFRHVIAPRLFGNERRIVYVQRFKAVKPGPTVLMFHGVIGLAQCRGPPDMKRRNARAHLRRDETSCVQALDIMFSQQGCQLVQGF